MVISVTVQTFIAVHLLICNFIVINIEHGALESSCLQISICISIESKDKMVASDERMIRMISRSISP